MINAYERGGRNCDQKAKDLLQKKFKNNIFRLNSKRDIDWCMNCHVWIRNYFYSNWTIRDPYQKKSRKFYLIQI
jgi:hypothetical protein